MGNVKIYGFFEPQFTQNSGNKKEWNVRLTFNRVQQSPKKIYTVPFINA